MLWSKLRTCSLAYGFYNRPSAFSRPRSPMQRYTVTSIIPSETCSASVLCYAASTSRNIPHQQVQQSLREHGGCPQLQICFKSMSTFCEEKCASSCWMHRLVSKISADSLISLHQAKLICVSEGKKRDPTLLNCTLAAGNGVERERYSHLH